jgi:7-carboxy-7-deazaguanine synthase
VLRISEIYTSFQGEGPRVGEPTVFVRFAGCNLRCPAWPCDTQHAIDPERYRNEWETLEPGEVANRIFSEMTATGARNICFTGGEPFLQQPGELQKLCQYLGSRPSLEVFTNGTIDWPSWAIFRMNFVLDWKLTGSGEIIEPERLIRNVSRINRIHDAIKFTIASKEDFDEAVGLYERFGSNLSLPPVYCGPVWNMVDPRDVAVWIIDAKLPWRLNIQTHKYIFGDVRGI